jgi:hydroxyacyl-ACP dehydratase HTD2-like protein with hotdog domain
LGSFTYTPTSPLLFRYSALTFNPHKIHYDLDWTRTIEGHPNLVVHGPLTATILVDLADQAANKLGRKLQKFEYRATSPVYIDKEVHSVWGWRAGQQVQDAKADVGEQEGMEEMMMIAEQDGKVGMRATAWLARG